MSFRYLLYMTMWSSLIVLKFLTILFSGIPNGVPFGITQISQGTSIRRSHGYNNTYHVGNTPSTMPKSRSDLSMHRTPSGKYYCPSCNMTVSSEALFTQHVESRKHKTISSPQRNNTSLDITNNNNNNNNNNMEQSPTHITWQVGDHCL